MHKSTSFLYTLVSWDLGVPPAMVRGRLFQDLGMPPPVVGLCFRAGHTLMSSLDLSSVWRRLRLGKGFYHLVLDFKHPVNEVNSTVNWVHSLLDHFFEGLILKV